MNRREFIVALGVAAWPLVARAQQPAVSVIGFLNGASPEGYANELVEFLHGLKDIGFVEGRNVSLEYRWAHGRYDQLPAMAAELVHRRVNVIAASGPAVRSAMAATASIPIVFAAGFDPIEFGLVTSLNRPTANVTGVSILNVELAPKRLELLRELIPTATVIALLVNPKNPNAEKLSQDMEATAKMLGLQVVIVRASSGRDFDTVFADLSKWKAAALVIGTDPVFTSQSRQLATLTIRHQIPTIYQYREFTSSGGLMSYGGSLATAYRLMGRYTGRILNGEKPADLPIQQTTKVELIINLRTAKSFGLTVPLSLLGRADEVIE